MLQENTSSKEKVCGYFAIIYYTHHSDMISWQKTLEREKASDIGKGRHIQETTRYIV